LRFLSRLNHRFDEPQLQRVRLPGGGLLLAERVPHVRSLALGIWLRLGSRDEEPAQAGISHLVEHMLFKGSRRYSGYQLAKKMEAIGGQVEAYTTKETTCYYVRAFEGHRRRAVEILGELLSRPLLASGMVRREIDVVAEEIQGYLDSPEELIHDLAAEVLWPRHPLGGSILGRMETLGSLNSTALRRYHRTRYAWGNMVIAAAGSLDVDRLADELAGHLSLPETPEEGRRVRIPRARQSVRHEIRPVQQAYICLLRRGPAYGDPRRLNAYVLNTILGTGASSRLFQAIREDEGLAYSVYSFLDSYRDTGAFGVYLGVNPARMRKALRLVCRELGRIRRHGVRAWELESAKAQIYTGLFLSYESMAERIGRMAHNEIYYGRHWPLEKVVARVDAVTREDVHRAAVETLDPGRFSLVTLGPDGFDRPGLEDLDF